MKTQYDYVVFGASVAGVKFALQKSMKLNSVLLVNQFGYPGGSITESLNCLQNISFIGNDPFYSQLLNEAFWDNESYAVLNPEVIKYKLQQFLENSNVDVLYHVVPFSTEILENSISLSFLAKEGIIIVHANHCIDSSADEALLALSKQKRTIKEITTNVFITPPTGNKFLSFPFIDKAIPLKDGRYWVSLQKKIGPEEFIDFGNHDLLMEFNDELNKSRSRLQLLPITSQLTFEDSSIPNQNELRNLEDFEAESLNGISRLNFRKIKNGFTL